MEEAIWAQSEVFTPLKKSSGTSVANRSSHKTQQQKQ